MSACQAPPRYQGAADAGVDLPDDADAPDVGAPEIEEPDAPPFEVEPGCPGAERLPGVAGCRFLWSPPQVSFRDGRPFALVIQGADASRPARVVITGSDGGAETLELAPGAALQRLFQPSPERVAGVTHGQHLWLTSDEAVVVTAWTPLAQRSAGTGDAAQLIPVWALGRRYVALSAPGAHGTPGFVTVTATQDGTTVTMTPSAAATSDGEPFAASAPVTRALDAGWSWSLATAGEGGDLTGTRIEASAPVVAFSGADCALAPTPESRCDHMLTALPPLEALGARYLLPQDEAGSIHFHVVAVDVEVEVRLPPDPPRRLRPGERWEISLDAPRLLEASAPVLVAASHSSARGPALSALPPLRAFGRRHALYHPGLAGVGGAQALVLAPRGERLEGVTPLGSLGEGGEWEVVVVGVEEGASELRAEAPVGVLVMNLSDYAAALWSTGWWR
jgi:hypothetical protein